MGKTAEEEEDNDHLFFSRGTKKQRRSLLPFVKGEELFFSRVTLTPAAHATITSREKGGKRSEPHSFRRKQVDHGSLSRVFLQFEDLHALSWREELGKLDFFPIVDAVAWNFSAG